MTVELDRDRPIGGDSRSYRYFRNAVERHWDPAEIDLSEDRVRIARLDDPGFTTLRRTLALFGAGEEAVTADLAPLAVVLGDVNDQLFVSSQLYEEAKHADFFHRYWDSVIASEEHARGNDVTDPTDDRWFSDAYVELFDRTERAMDRLLDEDTPENRARAYCHYHLTVEGILAQTGYYGVQSTFSGDGEAPELPGLVEGFSLIRADEGRHVGFGMAKLKDLVESGGVSASFLEETVSELLELTQEIVAVAPAEEMVDGETYGPGPEELTSYAAEKHLQRMRQITRADESIPDVEELVSIEEP